MTKTSKILATIGIIIVWMFFNAALQAGSGPGGRNPGVIGIILMFGVIMGIRAIWKKPKDNDNQDIKLNKD